MVHAVAIGLNMAAGAPAPVDGPVPAVVRGAVAVWPPHGESHRRATRGGAGLARLCSAEAAIEVVTPGVGGRCSGCSITGWHLPLVFMPQFDLALPDIASTVLVTFWYAWLFNRTGGSVLLPLIAHVTEGCVNTQTLWPAGPNADREDLDVVDRLGTARRGPIDLRSQVVAYGAGVGN